MTKLSDPSFTSLASVDRQLRLVKNDLARKVRVCARELQVQQSSSHVYVLEETVAEAASVFELVREETETIRDLKAKLDGAKVTLGEEVSLFREILEAAQDKVVYGSSYINKSDNEKDILMLEAKTEGAQKQISEAFKSIQELGRLEKELETALRELLPVLKKHQEKQICRIIRSKHAEEDMSDDKNIISDIFDMLPTKEASEIYVLKESIKQLSQERDTLKAELASHGSAESERVNALENQVSKLQAEIEVFELLQLKGETQLSIAVEQENEVLLEGDEDEDSYGFEDDDDVAAGITTFESPKDIDRSSIQDSLPVPKSFLMDQRKHEEELEEYAVQVLSLKEAISDLQEENRYLRAKVSSSFNGSKLSEEVTEIEKYKAEIALLKENAAKKSGDDKSFGLQKEVNRLKLKIDQDRIQVRKDKLEMKNTITALESEAEKKAQLIESLTVQLRDTKKELNSRWSIEVMDYD